MTTLKTYGHFIGRHWETGSVCNHFAHRGVTAPHTGQPYSEALLLGISGGVVMGYFSFAYEGYDPMAHILTRNTFSPMERTLERMGVVQHVIQTTSPQKAVRNLIDLLESGIAPIALADHFMLPYNNLPCDDGMWAMYPLVVFGYDEQAGEAWLADRSRCPLRATTQQLDTARARVKKDKFRLLELNPPNPEKLVSAVQKGIWDCIQLYTEKPPKGSKNNFGYAAYQRWADLLVKPKMRLSWEREFPAGAKMFAGLRSAFSDIRISGKDDTEFSPADRGLYADFLEEASQLLDKPGLKEVALLFRRCARSWKSLSESLLPDSVGPFGETRRLELRRHSAFLAHGGEALDEIRTIDARLEEITSQVALDFPLTESEVNTFRQDLSDQILIVHDLESEAVGALQEAVM